MFPHWITRKRNTWITAIKYQTEWHENESRMKQEWIETKQNEMRNGLDNKISRHSLFSYSSSCSMPLSCAVIINVLRQLPSAAVRFRQPPSASVSLGLTRFPSSALSAPHHAHFRWESLQLTPRFEMPWNRYSTGARRYQDRASSCGKAHGSAWLRPKSVRQSSSRPLESGEHEKRIGMTAPQARPVTIMAA